MLRRTWIAVAGAAAATLLAAAPLAAAPVAADEFVRTLSTTVIDGAKTDPAISSGDTAKVRALVDQKVVPHVNLERMTAMAVGPQWRQATPEQKKRLQDEFKTLVVSTYAGALTQLKDQTVVVKPLRAGQPNEAVVVRSEIRGGSEPIALDYRLESAGDAWKIYDVNVAGLWLVEAYKGQFAKDLSAGGVDKLIATLAEKNKK